MSSSLIQATQASAQTNYLYETAKFAGKTVIAGTKYLILPTLACQFTYHFLSTGTKEKAIANTLEEARQISSALSDSAKEIASKTQDLSTVCLNSAAKSIAAEHAKVTAKIASTSADVSAKAASTYADASAKAVSTYADVSAKAVSTYADASAKATKLFGDASAKIANLTLEDVESTIGTQSSKLWELVKANPKETIEITAAASLFFFVAHKAMTKKPEVAPEELAPEELAAKLFDDAEAAEAKGSSMANLFMLSLSKG